MDYYTRNGIEFFPVVSFNVLIISKIDLARRFILKCQFFLTATCSFLLLLALSLQYCRVDWVEQNQERSVISPENFWRSCEVKQDQK